MQSNAKGEKEDAVWRTKTILHCNATEENKSLFICLNIHPVFLNPTCICSMDEGINKHTKRPPCPCHSSNPAFNFTMLWGRQTYTNSCISAAAGSWCGPAPAVWPTAAAAPPDCSLSRACWISAPGPPGSSPSAWPALGGHPGYPCPCLKREKRTRHHVISLTWCYFGHFLF